LFSVLLSATSLSAQTPEDTSQAPDTVAQIDDNLAESIENLKTLIDSGNYAEAETQARALLSEVEAEYGAESLEAVKVLDKLIGVLLNSGKSKSEETKTLAEKAIHIKEGLFPKDDPEVARSLYSLASVYYMRGEYYKAVPIVKRTLDLTEKKLGGDHPDVARGLNGLAILYVLQGKLSQAEPLHLRALHIRETALGSDHLSVASSLGNLAILYETQGRYAEAEPLYRRALSITEKELGPVHPRLAPSLGNLAILLDLQGRHTEAEVLYKRALKINEDAFGLNHPDVASSLNNLALLYRAQGNYIEAEPLYKRSLAIWVETLGPKHPDAVWGMNNLANLYVDQDRYPEAEPLFLSALSILKKTLGPEHPRVTWGLNNLGNLYIRQGRYTEAETLIKESLEIERTAFEDNPRLSTSSNMNLAVLYHSMGRYSEAKPLYEQVVTFRRDDFLANSSVMAEKGALTYSSALRFAINSYISCYTDSPSRDQKSVLTTANIALSSKGLASDGVFERQGALVKETDSTTLALAEALRLTKFLVSKLYVSGPGEDAANYRSELDSLSKLANEQEADLARHSVSFRQKKDYENVSVDRIAKLLPKNSALIEFLRYAYYQLKPDTVIPHYLAIALDGSGEPSIVELGESKQIDSLIAAYRQLIAPERFPTKADLAKYTEVARTLYNKVWLPLDEY
jgi:tetratricopeptide (TPR) repeat protein